MTEHVCPKNAWPTGHPLPPERPELLEGPPVGTFCWYQPGPRVWYQGGERFEEERPARVVRVIRQSYVWSPGECRHGGGYRRYDWSVIEEGPNGYRSVCVDDVQLVPLTEDEVHRIVTPYTLKEAY